MKVLLFIATISLLAASRTPAEMLGRATHLQWTMQTSGVTVRLRGVSAVSDRIAWASGADSAVLRTTDGGATWTKLKVSSEPPTS